MYNSIYNYIPYMKRCDYMSVICRNHIALTTVWSSVTFQISKKKIESVCGGCDVELHIN